MPHFRQLSLPQMVLSLPQETGATRILPPLYPDRLIAPPEYAGPDSAEGRGAQAAGASDGVD